MPESTHFSNTELHIAGLQRGGHLLTSRYSLEIPSAGIAVRRAVDNRIGAFNTFLDLLNYRATSVTLPIISLASAPAKIFGTDYETPYQRNFDGTIDLIIIADKSNAIRNVFEDIIIQIQNSRTGAWGFRDEYVFDLKLNHLPRKDYVGSSYFIRECYPKTITSLEFNAAQNELVTFRVALSYRDYHTDFDIGLGGAPNVRIINDEIPNLGGNSAPLTSGVDFPDVVTPPIPPTDAFA